jgi:hypothetical protein
MNHQQRRHIALKATIPLGTAVVAALIVLALTSSLDTSTIIGLLIALVVYGWLVFRRLGTTSHD